MNYEDKLAALLCDYSLKIKRGDLVLIRSQECAIPLLRACYRALIKRGVNVLTRLSYAEQSADFFKYGSEEQFKYVSESEKLEAETITARIYLDSTDNAKQLSNTNPSHIAMQQKVMGDLREVMFEREAQGKFTWVLAPYPTQGMAQNAEMSLEEYTDFVYSACKLKEEDPVAAWREVDRAQKKIVERLTGTKTLRIVGKNTDLTVKTEGRKWKSCSGQRNMPDGEVFTSPVEDSAEGRIYFDLPTIYNGVEAKGIGLTFEKGKVVKAAAEKGEDYLLKMLDTDEGARLLGETAFGLNENITRATGAILFDEKIGKTMHLAVGASYPETGGKNKSALHWDLIKDMRQDSTVEADGKVIYKNGKFIEG